MNINQEGIRAIIEGIYEAPELVDVEKFDPDNPKTFLTPQEKQKITVDRIAEALGLDWIGWIQTCTGCERDTLPSDVIVKAA